MLSVVWIDFHLRVAKKNVMMRVHVKNSNELMLYHKKDEKTKAGKMLKKQRKDANSLINARGLHGKSLQNAGRRNTGIFWQREKVHTT